MKMPTTVTFLARKGGEGKSTMAWNFAAYLASQGNRVLIIETDTQGSLAKVLLGVEAAENLLPTQTIHPLFDERMEPEPTEMIHSTARENLFLLPATHHTSRFVEANYRGSGERQFAIRQFVAEIAECADFVICDAPPAIDNLMTWAAIMASNFVISTTQPSTMSVHSCEGVVRKVMEAVEHGNPRLQNLGFVITKKDSRVQTHQKYEDMLRQAHVGLIFDTVLNLLVSPYENSVALGQDLLAHDKSTRAARQLVEFSTEALGRINGYQKVSTGRAA